jgi:CRISPR-associated protein Cmr2
MLDKKHLFLFTIGPVQSFIAQARKTQDLYAGSQILSQLVKTAIDIVGRENVVFPHAPKNEADWKAIESLPNRFIAIVDTPQEGLKALGKKTEDAVRKHWKGEATKTFSKAFMIKLEESSNFNLNFAGINQQIDSHLDIHWIFEPYTEGVVGDYERAFKNIEIQLGSIKNVRSFQQFDYNGQNNQGERGRKCSLDGQRNIMFYRKNERQRKEDDGIIEQKYLFSRTGQSLILGYDDFDELPVKYLQPGEGLSAVSFVKRYYKGDDFSFESTADISLLNVIDYWKTHHKEQLNAYKEHFKSNFNAQLFYEDNLNESYFENQGLEKKLVSKIPMFKTELALLEKKAKETGLKLSKYYAVIAFDGDSMGRWLGGEFLADGKNLIDFHTHFAKNLSVFAGKAKSFLNAENRGRTVYAGGDDFLGLINLNHLFEVLSELRQLFDENVSTPLADYRKDRKPISFSAGISIVHYKEPLSIALTQAKEMEDDAKDKGDRDAFAIATMRGSGQSNYMRLKFENEHINRLKELTEALRDDVVSNTFIQSFDRTFSVLMDKNGKALVHKDLLMTEFNRLILRGRKSEDESKIKSLTERIWAIYNNENKQLNNFIEVLDTCNFIHRHLSKKLS